MADINDLCSHFGYVVGTDSKPIDFYTRVELGPDPPRELVDAVTECIALGAEVSTFGAGTGDRVYGPDDVAGICMTEERWYHRNEIMDAESRETCPLCGRCDTGEMYGCRSYDASERQDYWNEETWPMIRKLERLGLSSARSCEVVELLTSNGLGIRH